MTDCAITNDSEQYRMECEARHVMKFSKEHRQGYYEEVARIRGKVAAKSLIEMVNKMWKGAES